VNLKNLIITLYVVIILPYLQNFKKIKFLNFQNLYINNINVRTYVLHMLETYVTILCNWIIF